MRGLSVWLFRFYLISTSIFRLAFMQRHLQTSSKADLWRWSVDKETSWQIIELIEISSSDLTKSIEQCPLWLFVTAAIPEGLCANTITGGQFFQHSRKLIMILALDPINVIWFVKGVTILNDTQTNRTIRNFDSFRFLYASLILKITCFIFHSSITLS